MITNKLRDTIYFMGIPEITPTFEQPYTELALIVDKDKIYPRASQLSPEARAIILRYFHNGGVDENPFDCFYNLAQSSDVISWDTELREWHVGENGKLLIEQFIQNWVEL